MKKIFALVLVAALMCAACLAESNIKDLYEYDGETYDVSLPFDVNFAHKFTLTIPAGWQDYDVTEEQSANGFLTCFGDGTHFMFVKFEADVGAYEDINEYALTLSMNGSYASIFTATLGEGEFVCYDNHESASSDCATLIKGLGLYTFCFYPADGDGEFAQTVINLMSTFKLADTE